MKDEKLTMSVLRREVAQQAGISEAESEKFLNALVANVATELRNEKQIRINGLGTFKVQHNAPRRSVNVQTGEAILLPERDRVVFQPEAMLRESINLPLVLEQNKEQTVETVAAKDSELDPLQKLGEQANEIKDILADLNEPAEVAQPQEPEAPAEEPAEPAESPAEEPAEPAESPAPSAPAETLVEQPAENNAENKIDNSMKEEEKQKPEEPIILGSNYGATQTEEDKPKEKKSHMWLIAGITILIFIILLIFAYFFLRHQLTEWADGLLNKEKQTEQVAEPVSSNETEIVAEFNTDTIAEETLPAPEYNEFYGTERLNWGSRLALLSRKYYGAPDFWVYIYEANADKINDPNLVRVGTKVRIPKLPAELVDPNSEAALKQAHELHNQILGKK